MKRTDVAIPRASKEQVLSAGNLTEAEVRFIVTNYYDAQDARKRGDMQLRHLGDKDDPTTPGPAKLLSWWTDRQADIEKDILKMLKAFADSRPVGQWMMAQHGIGPVIAAGLLAHIDIEKAPTVGHIWRFAGLDPTCTWKKGEKRPFNAQLKQICWHAGQCFKRQWTHADCFYGHLYGEKKKMIVERNEAGHYAERAKVFVTRSADVRKTLADGKLPANNLDAQATRFATKIFLSHMHAVMYWTRYHKAPPKPFAISILGHVHEIAIPNTDMFPGFADAYYGRDWSVAAE
jgi:hypothetical protein